MELVACMAPHIAGRTAHTGPGGPGPWARARVNGVTRSRNDKIFEVGCATTTGNLVDG